MPGSARIPLPLPTWGSQRERIHVGNATPTPFIGHQYIELQYHGKLTMDDVESLTFRQSPDELLDASVIRSLRAKGIELWYFDGNQVTRYR